MGKMKKHAIATRVIALLPVIVLIGVIACAKPAGPAEFQVASLKLSPSEVSTGELVAVIADIENIGGAEGTYNATLKVDGVEVETKDVVVAAGDTETILFEVTRDAPGTYTVSLGKLTATFEVKPEVKGELIVFDSDRDGDCEIYVMNSDGSNAIKLTDNPARDTSPSWSPDGKKIVFDSDRDGDREIYVMNPDGSNVVKLTDNSIVDLGPSWSPDSKQIAFRAGESISATGIYVMNADGSNRTHLANPNAYLSNQAWSPDGSKIVFSLEVEEWDEIYMMNSDGSNKRRLIEPVWSRDKKMLDGCPAWSPTGDKMAFYSFRHGLSEESPGSYSVTGEIFVMQADGSNVVRLTHDPRTLDFVPSWSPDGKRIVFASKRDGDLEIYVMNSDGSNVVRLTDNTAEDNYPSWALVGE